MKNLLIYANPRKDFDEETKILAKIQVDNMLHFGWKNFGVLITDSHTTPLRRGVTGIALSYWGFSGVQNKVGTPDLFGRTLKMTHVNLADAFAAAAVLVMGESNESTPVA